MEGKKIKVIKGTGQKSGTNPVQGRKPRVCAYCRVSTNTAEQKDSFDSQVKYYTDLISSNPAWVNVGIYADQGITGTSAEDRPEFQRMIADAMNGKIDIILTKSISRFSRNTLDMLNYVRMLKDKRVEVRFEEDHLNTLSQEGEMILTMVSSIAQQEVVNTSEHVKKGLAMKMSSGQLVGFSECLGYDVDPKKKELVINEKEAEIVRYIFKRYNEGIGTTVLARELEERGYKTKYGSSKWADSTILGILKNEKYKGDLLQGKTFTVDPISKRRLENKGEADQFYMENHHQAIVSREEWDKANELLKKRSYCRKVDSDGNRYRFSRQYAFSSALECGFCGKQLSRRHWRGGVNYEKTVWQCSSFCKKGKETCEHSKAIREEAIQRAFLEAYRRLFSRDEGLLNGFLQKTESYLKKSGFEEEKSRSKDQLLIVQKKIDKLASAYVDGTISEDAYQGKLRSLNAERTKLTKELEDIELKENSENETAKKIDTLKRLVEASGEQNLSSFSRDLFDACIEKVIVGGYSLDKTPDPYMLTFVFKKEFGDGKSEGTKKYNVVGDFNYYFPHSVFDTNGKRGRLKYSENYIRVQLAIDME